MWKEYGFNTDKSYLKVERASHFLQSTAYILCHGQRHLMKIILRLDKLSFEQNKKAHSSRLIFFDKYREELFRVASIGGTVVLSIQRSFKLFKKKIKVLDVHRNFIGVVRKHFSLLHPKIQILDENGQELFWIKGPKDVSWHKLKIGKVDQKEVGIIKRKWCQHRQTGGDTFDIRFPLTANMKARSLIVAAILSLNMLWFENTSESQKSPTP